MNLITSILKMLNIPLSAIGVAREAITRETAE